MSRLPAPLGAGVLPNGNASSIYALNDAEFNAFNSWLYNISNVALRDIAESVISMRMYPFNVQNLLSSGGSITTVKCGRYDSEVAARTPTTSGQGLQLTVGSFDLSVPDTPDRWRYYNARYVLYLPYYGFLELPADQILNDEIRVHYMVDVTSGTANISISNIVSANTIATRQCQLAVDLPVASNLSGENTARAVSSTISLLGSGATLAAGVSSGNVGAIASGVAGVATGAMDLRSIMSAPDINGGINGPGLGNMMMAQTCFLLRIMPRSAEPTGYAAQYGRPSMRSARLSTLTGYTQVASVHMDGFGTATDSEIQQIEAALRSGVIL